MQLYNLGPEIWVLLSGMGAVSIHLIRANNFGMSVDNVTKLVLRGWKYR